ncbi:DUF4381 domain-containing protein [Gimesia panareensis]|uniref:Uncharacterized protein n=1 Tax=Gimesia panareensis TaxID=2527978 RepID=A0A517QAZ8_9PLAN|nr:DUF4381 domain-containing protein [Gimesia panareensis]QDT28802.1 hypothetical protein Enr10x_41480 [Gimesia panareensis]QDU51647.1 hypothetical protein Pan110_40140 [Gimesia panareensis]
MKNDATSLDRMHDIVLPDAIPWWPPAPGWYVVLAALGGLVLYLSYRGWRHWEANRYRRLALRELEQAHSILEVSELLRRTALMVVPRAEVAAQTGAAWPTWLAAHAPLAMDEQISRQLTVGVYDGSTGEIEGLKQYAAGWIRQHRLPELQQRESR